MKKSALVLAALAVVGLSSSCAQEKAASPTAPASSGSTTSAGAGTSSGSGCDKATLPVKTAGKFTVATDDPAYGPWFKDNTPSNGQGFESAVAYAVADKLGFAKGDVTWVKVGFTQAVTPGDKTFDVDINQFSITDERKKAVDFSSPYYTATQTIITTEGSKIAAATTLAALKDAKLGAQVGTTSLKAITEQIKPAGAPAVFDTNDLAVQALKSGQVDGIVVDLPTAFYMTGAQLDKGKIVGQLPASATGDQLGMLLTKGSPLTACVSKAVDALQADGTLAKLQTQWLSGGGAPELK